MTEEEKNFRGVKLEVSNFDSNGLKSESTQKQQRKGNMTNMDIPIDYSFLRILTPADILSEKPRGVKELKGDEKYNSRLVKLNNNEMQDLNDLIGTLRQVIETPEAITLLDLSFNNLTTIDKELCELKSLHVLYLHGNNINEISEVDKLSEIKTLQKLALHGNAVEKKPNYRGYVVWRIPQLISFDMSRVTNADREDSGRWFKYKIKSHRIEKIMHSRICRTN